MQKAHRNPRPPDPSPAAADAGPPEPAAGTGRAELVVGTLILGPLAAGGAIGGWNVVGPGATVTAGVIALGIGVTALGLLTRRDNRRADSTDAVTPDEEPTQLRNGWQRPTTQPPAPPATRTPVRTRESRRRATELSTPAVLTHEATTAGPATAPPGHTFADNSGQQVMVIDSEDGPQWLRLDNLSLVPEADLAAPLTSTGGVEITILPLERPVTDSDGA